MADDLTTKGKGTVTSLDKNNNGSEAKTQPTEPESSFKGKINEGTEAQTPPKSAGFFFPGPQIEVEKPINWPDEIFEEAYARFVQAYHQSLNEGHEAKTASTEPGSEAKTQPTEPESFFKGKINEGTEAKTPPKSAGFFFSRILERPQIVEKPINWPDGIFEEAHARFVQAYHQSLNEGREAKTASTEPVARFSPPFEVGSLPGKHKPSPQDFHYF